MTTGRGRQDAAGDVLSGPAPTSYERTLEVEAQSVGVARRLGQRVCHRWQVCPTSCDDVALVISELAGNAVRHGATGTMLLRLLMTTGHVRVELCENSPGAPVVRQPQLEAESGRGMWLVSALADRWGVELDPVGKRTWAELALSPTRVG